MDFPSIQPAGAYWKLAGSHTFQRHISRNILVLVDKNNIETIPQTPTSPSYLKLQGHVGSGTEVYTSSDRQIKPESDAGILSSADLLRLRMYRYKIHVTCTFRFIEMTISLTAKGHHTSRMGRLLLPRARSRGMASRHVGDYTEDSTLR